MSKSQDRRCTCHNPNGFKFLYAEEDQQVWEHLECGGLVTRVFIRSGEQRSL